MSGGRVATLTPATERHRAGIDRYVSGVDRFGTWVGRNTPVTDRNTPGLDRYGTGLDRGTPGTGQSTPALDGSTPGIEMSNSCRGFLRSRLKAAELINHQLSTDTNQHRHSCHSQSSTSSRCSIDLAIEKLRAELVTLIEMDIDVIRQLLAVNEQMEEVRWQRTYGRADSTCTPSYCMSGSCTTDLDLSDIEPGYHHDYPIPNTISSLSSFDDSQADVARHDVTDEFTGTANGGFGDDVTDDVFQTDESTSAEPQPQNTANKFKATENSVKVITSDSKKDKIHSSKVKVLDKAEEKLKSTKLEFQVNNATGIDPKNKNLHPEVKVKNPVMASDKVKTAKVEFRVEGRKDDAAENKKKATPQYEIRFKLQSPDTAEGRKSQESRPNRLLDVSRLTPEGVTSSHDAAGSRRVKPAVPRRPVTTQRSPVQQTTTGSQLHTVKLGQRQPDQGRQKQGQTGHIGQGQGYTASKASTAKESNQAALDSDKEGKKLIVVRL